MKDGLTRDERAAISRLVERQADLATRLDTEHVRALLHGEVEKIRACGLARVQSHPVVA